MVNPRFLEMARRLMREEVPEDRVIEEKPRDEDSAKEPKLIQILDRDENGRPVLKLTPIKKTVVNTTTQEEYDTLMQVYECGGWKGITGKLPITYDNWHVRNISTCLRVEDKFWQGNIELYESKKYNIISTQVLYEKQRVTQEMIDEINEYYIKNYPDRRSKG